MLDGEHLGVPLLRLHDQGDRRHSGTIDMDTMKKWKTQVRRWVGIYLKPTDCSALDPRRGALPNEQSKTSEVPDARSEQFLGWRVAFYAGTQRGRWQLWTRQHRDEALSFARYLIRNNLTHCEEEGLHFTALSRIRDHMRMLYPDVGVLPGDDEKARAKDAKAKSAQARATKRIARPARHGH